MGGGGHNRGLKFYKGYNRENAFKIFFFKTTLPEMAETCVEASQGSVNSSLD